jgi:hypothetical protein
MKAVAFLTLALCVSACGGGNDVAKEAAVAKAAVKTILTDEQFAELKANCNLGDAELRNATSTQTVKDEDGVTATETVTYEGPANQKTILLLHPVGEEAHTQIQTCVKAELERLGAVARLEPPVVAGP